MAPWPCSASAGRASSTRSPPRSGRSCARCSGRPPPTPASARSCSPAAATSPSPPAATSRGLPSSTAPPNAVTSSTAACGPSPRSRNAGSRSSRRSTGGPWAAAASWRWPATSCWPPRTPPSACPRRPSGSSPASGSCGRPPSSGGRRPSSWSWPASGSAPSGPTSWAWCSRCCPRPTWSRPRWTSASGSPTGRRSRSRSASAWSTAAWTAARPATASRPSPCCTLPRTRPRASRPSPSGASRASRGAELMSEPLVTLMRRYCIDYTARHDLSVCDDIMDPGYTLHMGTHDLAGRDDAYKPAAAAQFRQFPGLCLTVSEIVCSGDRLALRFTEHGASVRHDGALAAWGGVGLYRWDGQRLLENYVEQDYFARRLQLAGDGPDPVEPPAVAPWDTRSVPADLAAEAVVRGWLADGDLTGVTVDDGHPPAHPLVAAARTEIR